MGRLQGKVALITGAASGIGAASARLFVQEGAKVVLADYNAELGARVAEPLGEAALFRQVDVRDEAAIEAAVGAAVATFGRLDCMFSNAGVPGVGGSVLETDLAAFDDTVGVLLRSVLAGIKHAGRVMVGQGEGSIINTASVAALSGGFGPHVYSACKAAVKHLTQTTALELGEKGVRVNCICPGGIATAIFGTAMGQSAEAAQQSAVRMQPLLAQMQPIRRAGSPDDIAEAALWLASNASSFVNGHALVVDGGLTGGRMWSETEMRREALQKMLVVDGD